MTGDEHGRSAVTDEAAPAEEQPLAQEPPEARVPGGGTPAVVARVQAACDSRPSLGEIPLDELLAEVNRRSAELAVRLRAAERDAERFRRIAAVLRDQDAGL